MKDDREAFKKCFKEGLKTLNEAAEAAGQKVKEEIGMAPYSHFAGSQVIVA